MRVMKRPHFPTVPAAALACGLLAACSHKAPAPPAAGVEALEVVDVKPGSGAAVTRGRRAVVQYTGWLYDAAAPGHQGRQFDSSRATGQPFRFVVGAGNVIPGWDQGVLGMQIGGERRLVIPARLAYGDTGAGGVIPPGATLIFDIDLIGIE